MVRSLKTPTVDFWAQMYTNDSATHIPKCTHTRVQVPNILLQRTLTHRVYKQMSSGSRMHFGEQHPPGQVKQFTILWTHQSMTRTCENFLTFSLSEHTWAVCYLTWACSRYILPLQTCFWIYSQRQAGLTIARYGGILSKQSKYGFE